MPEITVRIQEVMQETPDVKLFRLVSADGPALPAFTAGSHIDVHLPSGIVRQYSLCSDPADHSAYLIGVKLEPESCGGSRAMHQELQAGDTIRISHPRNHFALGPAASYHLLIAGGIGITPLLCMALHLQTRGQPFHLHYFSRAPEATAFHAMLNESRFKGMVSFHHETEPARVQAALRAILQRRPEGGHLYLCGPRPFMDLAQAMASPGWPNQAIHLEHFSANPDLAAAPASAFTVRLARSGGEYTVAADQSIVSALADHEIYLDTSCEQGTCGTCILDVLEGTPDHRDEVLSAAEKESGKKIVPCVSRAKSRVLVLDY